MIIALKCFSALSQETRLNAFRILVQHGKEGIAAGALSEKLGIPHNTLSFHLSHLSHAGLVNSRKKSRSVIYAANLDTVQTLIGFMVENCCAADNKTCERIDSILSKCAC